MKIYITLIVFFLILLIYSHVHANIMSKKKIISKIINKAKEKQYDKQSTAMILAIVEQESSFNPYAQTKTKTENSYGLFQFNLNSLPVKNIDIERFKIDIDYQLVKGFELFDYYLHKYKLLDIPHVWNLGETKFAKNFQSPNYTKYIEKYKKWLKEL